MPTQAQIRAAIKAKLLTVTDIGVVHDYERYAKSEGDFRTFYKATIGSVDQIRGWHIRRTLRRESSPFLGRYVVTHGWSIRGYLGLDDAAGTEKTFDNLIEAIVDAFRTDENLGGLVSTTVTEQDAGIQLEESLPVMLAGVLCHGCRLRLTTVHQQ